MNLAQIDLYYLDFITCKLFYTYGLVHLKFKPTMAVQTGLSNSKSPSSDYILPRAKVEIVKCLNVTTTVYIYWDSKLFAVWWSLSEMSLLSRSISYQSM